jgi:tetratricopeptide (TPR) repeat protein
MKKNMPLSLFFLLFMMPFLGVAQESRKHDSIMALIRQAPDDSLKAVRYLALGELYLAQQQDTAIMYYQKAFELARRGGHPALAGKCLNYAAIGYLYRSDYDKTIDYLKRSVTFMKQAADSGGMANAFNNLGVIYKNRGDFEHALYYLRKTARIREALVETEKDSAHRSNNVEKLGHVYNNQGNIHYQFGDYSMAIRHYKKSLGYYERVDYSRGISAVYNNIGNVFEEQKRYDKALEYYGKALALNRGLGIDRNTGTCLNNIGEVHLKNNKLRKARRYFERSLDYRTGSNDKRGISAVYSNLAVVNMKTGDYDVALDQLHEALKLDNETGDKKAMAEDLVYIAEVYLNQDRLNRSIEFAMQGRELADSIQAPLQRKNSLEVLARAYEKRGDYRRALEYTRMYEEVEDFLFNKEKNEQIEELETRYQLDKKQEEIRRQEQLLEQKETLIRKQKVRSYAYLGAIVFVVAVSALFYFNYRQKRNAHRMLMEQNQEIENQNEELTQQNEEITNQRDELQQQRNLTHKQRNEIALKNDAITSGLHYARMVQSGLLMPERTIGKLLPASFIFFQPREMVSGDFYWVRQRDDQVIFAVADCTGHGVPGALMTTLGMSLLNEAVNESPSLQAGDVLNRLRVKFIHVLRQSDEGAMNRNSMDVSLCIWNQEDNILQYAGAYHPLYMVRGETFEVYRANRMNIGLESGLDSSFTTHRISLESGDMVYLFSDGYADQPDHQGQEKMKISRFRQLIRDVAHLEPPGQKVRLEGYFNRWKGDYEQVDDVLVMGVRF